MVQSKGCGDARSPDWIKKHFLIYAFNISHYYNFDYDYSLIINTYIQIC